MANPKARKRGEMRIKEEKMKVHLIEIKTQERRGREYLPKITKCKILKRVGHEKETGVPTTLRARNLTH